MASKYSIALIGPKPAPERKVGIQGFSFLELAPVLAVVILTSSHDNFPFCNNHDILSCLALLVLVVVLLSLGSASEPPYCMQRDKRALDNRKHQHSCFVLDYPVRISDPYKEGRSNQKSWVKLQQETLRACLKF